MAEEKINRVYGDVKVDLGGGTQGTIKSSGEASLDHIMRAAAAAWADVNRSGIDADDAEGSERLLKKLQRAHPDFATSYPIPFRWMVQAREYEPKVFGPYVLKHTKMMYKDRGEFIKAQAEYLVMLYKHRNPRAGARQIIAYRKALAESLEKDDKEFAKAREEADAEVKKIDEENDLERRQRIKAFILKMKSE